MDLRLLRRHAAVQPTSFHCGPCALRHAFLCHGQRIAVRRIGSLCGTTPEGTDWLQLATAADALGFRLTGEQYTDHFVAYQKMREHLDAGAPVIVCVDAQDHWITVVDGTARKATVADSSDYGDVAPVIHDLTWRKLLSRMCVWTPERTRFDLYPVTEAER